MKKFTIKLYRKEDFEVWNAFVAASKNGTFLFHRNFMEYHSDRFSDNSLMVYESEKLVAVLPANRVGNTVFSHSGLTYGGLVFADKFRLEDVIVAFKAILSFLDGSQIDTLHLKSIPHIYHQRPSQEVDYSLFLAKAALTRRDTLSVIEMKNSSGYSEIRKRGIKKAALAQLKIREENNFSDFWTQILIPNLKAQHGASPVHSLEEIIKLKQFFPKNIRQFNVYADGKIVSGTTIFETETVAHAQYISADENRETPGSLDFLYDYLLKDIFKEKKYFDFGISNENGGSNLNSGLSYWKESFGASTVVHDFYEVKTSNFKLLENVMI